MGSELGERLQVWGFSWQGLRDNSHGEWWLLAQMLLISAHWLPPTPTPAALGIHWPMAVRVVGAITVVVGLALGAQGTVSLGESLSPLPEPMPGAVLVTEGAYGRCRHPLYQSLLTCSLGVAIALGSLLHLGLLLAFVVVLGQKARREEARLIAVHHDYAAYRASMAAIVPRLPWLDWRTA